MDRIESGEQQIDSKFECCGGAALARDPVASGSGLAGGPLEGSERTQARRPSVPPRNIPCRNCCRNGRSPIEICWPPTCGLQEVNRQKTVFLASAAHELKTPLAVIKGYYDLLLSGSLGKLTDKQRDILQESKESCERLVRLVSMFLNYSALESGKLVLHLRENDLRDCLGELATRWHEAFVRKHVRLDTTLNSDMPIFKFDYQKVQQTVANLLDNALKHTPAGGHVTCARNSTSGSGAPPRRFRPWTAAASASSIPTASRFPCRIPVRESPPNITRKFSRILCAWIAHPPGMGLGLAIAKRLVQAHRGKIWVDSEPRRGCTFTFLLPIDNV